MSVLNWVALDAHLALFDGRVEDDDGGQVDVVAEDWGLVDDDDGRWLVVVLLLYKTETDWNLY